LVLGGGFSVLGFGVDFGDQDRRLGSEVAGKFLPGWGEGFAVWREKIRNYFMAVVRLSSRG
jgi:hypothetical protein